MVVKEAATTGLVIMPVIYMGIIIGLYELIAIHRDVGTYRGSHWIGHGLHSILFVMIALFITMNTNFVYENLTFLQNIPFIKYPIVFQVLVGLILMIKVHIVSAAVKGAYGRGMKETWIHSLIIGALVVAAPYIWQFIQPAVENFLPGV